MKANKLTPNFGTKDIKETVEFYTNVLGFNLNVAVPETQDGGDSQLFENKEYIYVSLSNGDVDISFQRMDSFREDISIAKEQSVGASISFYIEVEKIEALYSEIKNKVSEITELKTTWYGMREFYIRDNNGYLFGFAEKSN